MSAPTPPFPARDSGNGDADLTPIDLRAPQLYLNRELSRLDFYERVLQQARDESTPLLERIRFLAISAEILDEFFEIRVAGLKAQIERSIDATGPDGLSPTQSLHRIREKVLGFVARQYQVLNDEVLPALEAEGVAIYTADRWTPEQRAWIEERFRANVLPVLTPVAIDPAHPFPPVHNKSLNFMVSLSGRDAFGRKARNAVVHAPRILPRVIQFPPELSPTPFGFVLLSVIIEEFVSELFPGMTVSGCHPFRVTRNSDLWIDEEAVDDFLHAIRDELSDRDFGQPVRLEVSVDCPDDIVESLLSTFGLTADDVYHAHGPVNLHRLVAVCSKTDVARLKYRSFIPHIPDVVRRSGNMFDLLRHRDLLLHHPYQSFLPVVELVEQAAADPDVLAIKQTVYRIGTSSRLENALIQAAEAGKEVTVVVELRARFDEARNIELARRLQEAGANVVYGVVGHKTHVKMLLIVRREEDELRRYVHLGTGNYHETTTRLYTDFGFLTSRPEYGEDVHAIFHQLTGMGKGPKLNLVIPAPFSLREYLVDKIEAEIEAAERGEPARIAAKMNSLIEPEIIEGLYRASQAGVQVDLVVRGICCLRPGIPGISENIRVRSIVGRFLEHHRVFYFHAGGEEICLMSSADWMPRNLRSRVEVAFPLPRKRHRRRLIKEGIDVYLGEKILAWEMDAEGSYRRVPEADIGAEDVQDRLLGRIAAES